MSAPDENELVATLLWSDNDYSLEKFVERFKLPQLVRVEVGYFTTSERTSLECGQVLVLHSVEKTKKLVCESPSFKNAVVVPHDCPVKALVLPRTNVGKATESISAAQFAPLLDCRPYTLAEVKQTFGLPANVRFLEAEGGTSAASMLVSNLGEVTVVEEIEQTIVVSTTVGGIDPRRKDCLEITTDLPVQVSAVKGRSQAAEAGGDYQRIVDTLDKQFKRTRIKDSRHLYVYEHIDAVKKNIYDAVKSTSVTFAERTSDTDVRGRLPDCGATLPSSQRSVPPGYKAAPKVWSKPAQKTKPSLIPSVKHNSSNLPGIGQRLEPTSVTDELDRKATVDPRWRGTLKSEGDYEYAFLQPLDTFVDEPIYDMPDAKCTSGNLEGRSSTCVDKPTLLPNAPPSTTVPAATTAQSSTQASHSLVKPAVFPKQQSDPVPAAVTLQNNSMPPVCGIDKNDGTLKARFPDDLSGLSVRQVGEILTALRMGCYRNVFREEFVDGEMLKILDRESLQALGLNAFHVKKLITFIEGWRPNV